MKLVKDGIRFRVVFSVDGGGIRGMIPALYFHWLETSLGQNMCNVGDLFAGTSVGGIIACGLNRPSAPMEGCRFS